MIQIMSQLAFTVKVAASAFVMKKTFCVDVLQPSATYATRGSPINLTSGRFLKLPTTAIRVKFSPIENYPTSGTFFESADIWVRSLTQVFMNLPEIREGLWNGPISEFCHLSGVGKSTKHPRVSRKFQRLGLGIFPGLVNLPNIWEVLRLVLFSQVSPCVFILIVLLNFVNRYATVTK